MTIVRSSKADQEKIPDGFPVKNVACDEAYIQIDITRRSLRLVGTAYDINRLKTACDITLKAYEHKRIMPFEIKTVIVHAPSEDES